MGRAGSDREVEERLTITVMVVLLLHLLILEETTLKPMMAAVQAPRLLNLATEIGPYVGEDVIFIANDWHAALVPLYLKNKFKSQGIYSKAKVVMCVHNLFYQGRFPAEQYSMLDLPEDFQSAFGRQGRDSEKKGHGQVLNWLRAGFEESDLLLTVSPTYAKEVSTEEGIGSGLRELISRKGMLGIMNGADVTEWSPVNDRLLDVKYDIDSVFEVKPTVKEQLQAEAGLPVRPDIPVFGFMGRLDEQKGSDILAAAIPTFLEQQNNLDDAQFILLGTGKSRFEEQLRQLESMFPAHVRTMVRFSPRLAHMMIAGCDYMVIPSRFEPGGLIQLHAMLYGTVPIVASTGGLLDSVHDGVTGLHMGKFSLMPDVSAADIMNVVEALQRAEEVYRNPSHFTRMVLAAMSQDLSWKVPARAWERALLSIEDQDIKSTESSDVVPGEGVERYLPARELSKEALPATV